MTNTVILITLFKSSKMGAGLEREGMKSYMCMLYEPKERGGGGQGSCTTIAGKVAGLLLYFPGALRELIFHFSHQAWIVYQKQD